MPQTHLSPAATAGAGSIPMIDYDNHPAYGAMFGVDTARAAEAIAQIEPVAQASLQAQGVRLERLRQRGDPGCDIPAGSPQERALLASEQRAIGPRGQMTLFDPDMMHRGGHVLAGERVAIVATMGAGWRKPD